MAVNVLRCFTQVLCKFPLKTGKSLQQLQKHQAKVTENKYSHLD